ncbi:fasciclin domain-containing protein [Pontibacter sp. H249]|uniref:fasciclin domain-containing protein n=1 Tax=Pontibacter sp. H249 TaxID=3133420 RepID=UPI0030BDD943
MSILDKITLRSFAIVAILFLTVQQVQAQQEHKSMLQYIIDNQPDLGELAVKAGLAPTLSGNTAYTFLMPSDADINNLKKEPAQRLRTILSGHILKGRYLESDFKDGATLETLAGTSITVCRKKDHTLLSGARVIEANTEVKNGIVHKLSSSIKL